MSQTLIDEIIRIAREDGADALLELSVSVQHEVLYDGAVEAFGSWDGALAQALTHAVQPRGSSAIKLREEEVVRKRQASASHPVFVRALDGGFFWIDGEELNLTEEPELLPTPRDIGVMAQMW